jgi:hypothetical protein
MNYVTGNSAEDTENAAGCSTEEEKSAVWLEEEGKKMRNDIKSRICYSGTVTYMKVLYKESICGYSLRCIELTYSNASGGL